ncbi:MAG: PhzF family phenazine biosynthesis protein [Gammaproteobacteria bacterium]
MSARIRLFHVDAFAERLFEGNPAAVCPLEHWLDDAVMQAIAAENNLSETAFFKPATDGFDLRWFTPAHEVDLCGHATLATAHVLFEHYDYLQPRIRFHTRSGELHVARSGEWLEMDLPAREPQRCEAPPELVRALGAEPAEVWCADDYLAVFDAAAIVRQLQPDVDLLRQLDRRGVIVTAPGEGVDFVSRFFSPKLGVPEDPVCGSAHCALTPYWARRLGRARLQAHQVSRRGGRLLCELRDLRVAVSGRAVTYLRGEIEIQGAAAA